MSKTYRRKNETWDFEAYDYSWENGKMVTFKECH